MSLLYRLGLRLITSACVVSLAACATVPEFRHAPTGMNPSPRYALQLIDQHPNVLWGGMILDIRHFERYTELEMLAFPLDSGLRPVPRARDAGRFVRVGRDRCIFHPQAA
jgi:starvation-inducible outer membrane lipoprotein